MTPNSFLIVAAGIALFAVLAAIGMVQYDFAVGGSLLYSAMAVQSAYSANQPRGLAGQIASMHSYDADSRICETAAGIGFGLAVGRGSADNGAVLGAAAAADFLGISIRDVTLMNDDGDEYAQNSVMGVLVRGDIWVTAGGDVADGADVTFASTTGVLSSAGTSGTQFAISGARWLDTVSSGAVARVRLSGHLPSA